MIKIKEEAQDIKKHYGFVEMSDEDAWKIYNFEKRRKEENNNVEGTQSPEGGTITIIDETDKN